ncbi:hypothetical protein F8388_014952 [Cannabis sativa]|uniref:DUF4283 domain-containing protein n=1 Tax=Cannabis sativa TaxID=3483 RepID=A0A7J6DWM9_CANSA|nr:hypothetical protein F8388_014952 [Cannabis sativa]
MGTIQNARLYYDGNFPYKEGKPSNLSENRPLVVQPHTVEKSDARATMTLGNVQEEGQILLEDSDRDLEVEMDEREEMEDVVGRRGLSKGRVKEVLEGIRKLKGEWRKEYREDKKFVLKKRPWLVNGTLLNIPDWSKDGVWQDVNMAVARYWVEAHGLPTPYLTWKILILWPKKLGSILTSIMHHRPLLREGLTSNEKKKTRKLARRSVPITPQDGKSKKVISGNNGDPSMSPGQRTVRKNNVGDGSMGLGENPSFGYGQREQRRVGNQLWMVPPLMRE